MKLEFRYYFLFAAAALSFGGNAQIITDTLYYDANGIDAHVNSAASTTNYGTSADCQVFYDYGSPVANYYTYMKMDFSSLPSNAVITKARLMLYAQSVNNGASHSMQADRITSSWTETGITFATVPSATSVGQYVMSNAATSSTGWHMAEITSQVQYQVANPASNYGTRILLQDRTGTIDKGVIYASSENGTAANRPYMIVEYYVPMVDTIYLSTNGMDAQVYSGATTTNYGTDTTLKVFWDYNTTSYANRTYLQADLSAIPRSSKVISANLNLYALSVDNSATHPMWVHAVTGSWTEGGITWANMPGLTSSYSTTVTDATTASTGWQSISITNLTQQSVWSPEKNYGWRMALQTESGTLDKGVVYASSEISSSNLRPYVTVEHQVPIEVSGYVTHATSAGNDGAITVSATGGCYSYTGYYWKKLEGGVYTTIETGSSMATADISGLSDGLYVFGVTDYRGGAAYRFFFVGKEGSTTNVSFNNAGAASIEDAYLMYYKSPADSNSIGGTATGIGCYTTTTYDARSVVQYQVDWDPSLDFSSARQAFRNKGGCYQSTTSDNDAWVSRITEPWEEDYVSWAIRPGTSATDAVYIPTTTVNGYDNRNDTISILDFIPYWQAHPDSSFGFEMALNDYTQANTASRDYSSSDYTGLDLLISYTVRPKIETVYYDSLGTGNITVNAPAGELPYTYLIGYNQIPSLNDIWNNIKDSIDIDSTVFFRGKSNTRNYTFSDMPAEHYFVAVFDNKGARIFDDEVLLTPDLTFIATSGLAYTGGNIQTTAMEPSGEATLDRVVEKNNSVAFEFVVNQLGNMVVGFNNFNDAQADSTHEFEFGIEINNTTKHFQVILGDSVLYEDTIIVNDLFRLGKENYDLVVYKNAEEYHRERVVPADDFKVDVVFKNSTGKLTKPVIIGKWPLVKPLKTTVYNTECDAGNGSIRISFAGSYFYSGTTSATYSVKDLATNTVVASGSITPPSYLTIPLPVGNYSVTYTWSNGTISLPAWTEFFTIGQPIEWYITNDFFSALSGTVNTIYSNTLGEEGKALSQNILKENVEGWATFNVGFLYKLPPAGSAPVSPILYANVKMVDESSAQKIKVRVVGMGSGVLTKYLAVYNSANVLVGSPVFIGSSDGPVKIVLDNGNFEVYYNNGVTPVATVAEGTTSDYRVYADAFSGNVHDSYASFCYGLTRSDICAHLDYELNGNYYVTNSGRFCFVYNEEYNDPNIQFNIYNNLQNVVATQADFVLEDLIYGENRVVLDFSSHGYCLPVGHYTLEVINDKGEKFYLRFYNRYNGCIPSDSAVPGGISY